MTIQIKISTKGQIVLPKDVRDRLGLHPGMSMDVIDAPGGVYLKVASTRKVKSFDQVKAELRKLYTHEGPALTIEEMDAGVDEMFRRQGRI